MRAAENAGQQAFAAKQLRMMAEAAHNLDLRQEIGEHLLGLDADAEADRVFGHLYEERNGLRPPAVADEGKLWAKLLRAALMGPKELQQQPWAQTEEEGEGLPSL